MNIQEQAKRAYSGELLPLYARDSRGKIKIWRIIFIGGEIKVHYGMMIVDYHLL